VTNGTGDEIPFFLHVPADCETDTATIGNGDERIPVDCARTGLEMSLEFPVWGTHIAAAASTGGRLEGSWFRPYMPEGQQRMAFAAVPIDTPEPERRFVRDADSTENGSPSTDLSGIWRMEFADHGPAKGRFLQTASGVVVGTAEVPAEYGDLRFLAGTLRDTWLSLSTFDGQHAYLLEARADPDGTLSGTFVCCDEIHDTFVAERSDDFAVVDPLTLVRVVSGEILDFEQLRKSRYAGKAVIVEIFGSWCPNCNDLAPLLTELYAEHRDDGLEMIGIAYEMSEDEVFTRERLRTYREKHGLDWEIVLASAPPEELFAAGSARLSPIAGVPVTIFLNRDRSVHAIYSGFSGPATGPAHDQVEAEFRTLTAAILASP
jgi:thiol-disulfide isomerase/thioredoxin